jgi:hypothetical protein
VSAVTRRIIAVSSDASFAGRLAAAIADPDTQVASDAGLEGALWVLDFDRATAPPQLAALPSTARVVAVVPGALGDLVDVWASDDRIVGCATDLAAAAALAQRVLEPPAVAALLAPGAALHTKTIADHDDKLRALEEASAFAERRLKGREATRTAVEQSIDELLMNALYAAPVAADGSRVFAGLSVKQRAALRTAASVTLTYGADAERFVVRVRDEFGSLDRATVLRVLHKGLHAEDKVDAKAGGAGLGLFLVASTASTLSFDVTPGGHCEITCLFELAGTAAPPALAFVTHAAHTPPHTATASRSAASRRQRTRIAIASVASAAALAALVAAGFGPGADQLAIEAPPGTAIEIDGRAAGVVDASGVHIVADAGDAPHLVIARLAGHASQRARVRAPHAIAFALARVHEVALDSQPSGAHVLDGDRLIGSTPMTLVAPRTVVLDKPGFRRATVALDASARAKTVALERAPDLVRVRVVSNPPGAEVRRGDAPAAADRTFTPADIYVKAGERQRFTLVMHAHTSVVLEASGTDGEVLTGELVPAN